MLLAPIKAKLIGYSLSEHFSKEQQEPRHMIYNDVV